MPAGRITCVAIVAAAACCLSLVAPGGAAGQLRTVGSRLDKAPNSFGCETRPTFTSQSFDGFYRLQPSGQPDCTWFSTDANGGGAPGDGRVTSVTIRSGADPPVVRFQVIRLFANPADGPQARTCCFFVTETPPIQARPGLSTHNVSLPVERHTNPATNLLTQDYVAVSAVAGTGGLPMFGNGRHNLNTDYVPGNPTAGFLYPRMGSVTGDGPPGGGRREAGIPGVEVLLRYTFCPAGQTCAGIPDGGGGTVGGGSGGPPAVTSAAFDPTVFRAAVDNRNTFNPEVARAARAKRGSTLSFKLSEAANVSIRIERRLGQGRRSKGKCRKPSRKLRKRKKCTRWKKAGTLRGNNRPAGRNTVRFSGRFRRKALKPGRYRGVILATDSTKKKSKLRTAKFRMVR
ncbi:MAG TPA: hypothetical protein VEX39_09390 [Thermoleophilaceae bacterium]|nr:hypothetical protein [Thermoleophilaceae bacterium]